VTYTGDQYLKQNKSWADGSVIRSIARERVVKLSVQFEILPEGLMIQEGITWGASRNCAGEGGFGVVFRAQYKGHAVALKRLKTFSGQIGSLQQVDRISQLAVRC
jgi:hypothetical protein